MTSMSDIQAPPALSDRPQFHPQYWAKCPRTTVAARIERITNLDDGWVEIAIKGGNRFRRRRGEIKQLLAANQDVHLEFVNKQLVTGLMVPGVGWAFRMTSDDLAMYTRALAAEVYKQERIARDTIEWLMAEKIAVYLRDRGISHGTIRHIDVSGLAKLVLRVLERGPAGG